MDGAQHIECAFHAKRDAGFAARCLISRIEIKLRGVDVSVMQEVAVVVDDLHRIPLLNGQFGGAEFTSLLRHDVWRYRRESSPEQQPEQRRQDGRMVTRVPKQMPHS